MTPEEHAEHRRKEILTAAREAFARHGYAATTMEEIAAAADISKGSLYNYFQNKDALFEQVLVAYVLGVEEEVEASLAQQSGAAEKIAQLISHWYRRLGGIRDMSRLVLEFWATAAHEEAGRISGTLSDLYARWRDRLAEIIAEGIAGGEFSDECNPSIQAALLLGLLDGIEIQTVLGTGVELSPALEHEMTRQVLAGLRASGGGGGDTQPEGGL